jgi:hypothetical protein
MSLENLHHFLNVHYNVWFNATWRRQSVAELIFYRTLAESVITVTPSVTCMDWLRWWCKHAAHVVAFSTALASVTNLSEKHKSTSLNAIQVKNQQKTISIDEKLDIKVNQLLTYAIMLDSLIVAYFKFMIMPIEWKKMLSEELKCLCIKTNTVLSEWTTPKTMDASLLHFSCIRNKYIEEKCI